MITKNIKRPKNQTDKSVPFDALVGLPPLQLNEIYHADSFELIERVPAKAVDLILEDMPYNTTACEWDVKIDLELYWKTRLRILKPTGVVILTATQPFSSMLVMSNGKMFKYDWDWKKSRPSGFLNAKKMPLRAHENILVFYNKFNTYNPQFSKGYKNHVNPNKKTTTGTNNIYGTYSVTYPRDSEQKYPQSVIEWNAQDPNDILHPTQKPVGLFEYLIRTYTNEGDLVFDGFGGSGTTAVAAHKSKRNFIVIEKEKKYFDLATRRLRSERAQLTML